MHHGFLPGEGTAADVSWSGIAIGVAVAISFALSASIVTVLGPGKEKPVIAIRRVCLAAFVVLVLSGRASVPTLLITEGLAMLMVVGLWLHAWGQAHPGSGMVLAAIFVSILAAAGKGGAASFTMAGWEFDPNAVYHLAQMPGIFLMFVALHRLSRFPPGVPMPGATPTLSGA